MRYATIQLSTFEHCACNKISAPQFDYFELCYNYKSSNCCERFDGCNGYFMRWNDNEYI